MLHHVQHSRDGLLPRCHNRADSTLGDDTRTLETSNNSSPSPMLAVGLIVLILADLEFEKSDIRLSTCSRV
jgi:hypothetical protein